MLKKRKSNKYILIALIAITSILFFGFKQHYPYPTDYFRSPLPEDVPNVLAGTFAELRPNHFHGGLDLKTGGQVGMELHAIADGYVSRLKVSTFGYGTTLYIAHPNGYTSVYAHLQEYSPKIEKFIRKIQIEKESWDIEVFPGKTELKVEKDEVVAISGNSGASLAPHLHFEIRETNTQTPVDPLLFGINIKDEISPRIYRFQVHALDKKSGAKVIYTNGKSSSVINGTINTRVYGKANNYQLYPVREIQSYGNIAFSLATNDFHTGSHNKLGTPLIEMKLDGEVIFSIDTEKIPFSKTRQLNAFIDYEAKLRQGIYYTRLHKISGNSLTIYPTQIANGIINLAGDTSRHKIEISLKDRNGNETTLAFDLVGLEDFQFPKQTIGSQAEELFKFDEENNFETDEIKLHFPKKIFYENVAFEYELGNMAGTGYSYVHKVHNGYTPLDRYYNISIKAHDLPTMYRKKAVIIRNGRSEGGYYNDGYVSSRSKYFGSFYINVDTLEPIIRPINIYEGKNMRNNSYISVAIGDHMSGIRSYKAYLDDKFIIMPYDNKTTLVKYYFESEPSNTEHVFKILVTDRVGNTAEKSYKFKR